MISVLRIGLVGVLAVLWLIPAALAGPFILVDIKTGEVLAADRPSDPWYPASITKLMTLYVTAKAVREGRLSMASTVTMSKASASIAPSKMGFAPGTQVTIENALPMLIVKSANDIAGALAERVSGSQAAFVDEMNASARRLGMSGSHFTNPHGLPSDQQYVTARDMALLGIAIHKEFPELLPLFGIPAIRHGQSVLRSYNLLLEHYRGASGMKTGFTCAAGLNMVAAARRDNENYLAVVLGELSTIDRSETAALLLEQGFSHRAKAIAPNIARYHPPATRATPVNMRSLVCGGGRKFRTYQVMVPPEKPKRGLFARDAYVSPQRKDFGPGLGDKSHPQGALIYAPRGRTYRSHILQPREERKILSVYAGVGQHLADAGFSIRVDEKARTRLAAQKTGDPAVADLAAGSGKAVVSDGVPLPGRKPVDVIAASLPASASAFVNAANGVGTAVPSVANSNLLGSPGARAGETSLPGVPLVLNQSAQVPGISGRLPRPRQNPVR